VMGCYGIGNTRLMGTIVEAKHDDKGMIWPKSVAPFDVHLVVLGNDEKVSKRAEELYEELGGAGADVLFDDRDESVGVKLNDADLIGIPLRLVVSSRTLEKESVEWKERSSSDSALVKSSEILEKVVQFLKD